MRSARRRLGACGGLALGLATAGLLAAPLQAASIEGVRFADGVSVDGTELRLHGTGLLRHRLLIKGYVAALYLDPSLAGKAAQHDVLADRPRRLEIEYFWPIQAGAFRDATLRGISRSVDPQGLQMLRGRIARLNALYRDVAPGDRYSLTYIPGSGTDLALNDVRLGRIQGADFAAALFSIWIGDEALDASLREQLLAGR